MALIQRVLYLLQGEVAGQAGATVVGGENNEGVIVEPGGLEGVYDPANPVVEGSDGGCPVNGLGVLWQTRFVHLPR